MKDDIHDKSFSISFFFFGGNTGDIYVIWLFMSWILRRQAYK
jgi:hypothetical protein